MGEPRLYERYERSEAIALFGSEAEPRSLCDGQWVIFPHVVIGFSEIGEPPKKSHFASGGEFCWVADKPYQVSDDKHIKFVPQRLSASTLTVRFGSSCDQMAPSETATSAN
jgi:hypothetical protein